jgi:hypothetical protein
MSARSRARTEFSTTYFGRFADGLQRGRGGYTVREYLLTDFDEGRLTEAILRPTREDSYRFA